MEEYKIEKEVPIKRKNRNYHNYPFVDMEVNDSFYVEITKDIKITSLQSRMANAASHFCKQEKVDWKFSCHQTGNGVRIWRVK